MDGKLRDELLGALIGIARAVDGNEHLIAASTDQIVQEGLSALLADADGETLAALIRRAGEEKRRLIPNCYACAAPCGKNSDCDMGKIWTADPEERALRSLLLLGVQGLAAYARRSAAPGETGSIFYRALFAAGEESFSPAELLPVLKEAGEAALSCMTARTPAAERRETNK